MATAKVFKSGNSQAVRLPKEFRFEGKEVNITRQGDKVILWSIGKAWTREFLDCLGKLPNDFKRPEQTVQEREEIFG